MEEQVDNIPEQSKTAWGPSAGCRKLPASYIAATDVDVISISGSWRYICPCSDPETVNFSRRVWPVFGRPPYLCKTGRKHKKVSWSLTARKHQQFAGGLGPKWWYVETTFTFGLFKHSYCPLPCLACWQKCQPVPIFTLLYLRDAPSKCISLCQLLAKVKCYILLPSIYFIHWDNLLPFLLYLVDTTASLCSSTPMTASVFFLSDKKIYQGGSIRKNRD